MSFTDFRSWVECWSLFKISNFVSVNYSKKTLHFFGRLRVLMFVFYITFGLYGFIGANTKSSPSHYGEGRKAREITEKWG